MKTDVERATATAEEHTKRLEAAALEFAEGRATREELLLAAKRATNAWHAVGRAKKR